MDPSASLLVSISTSCIEISNVWLRRIPINSYTESNEFSLTRLILLGNYSSSMPLKLPTELRDYGMQLGEPLLVPRRLLFCPLFRSCCLHLCSDQSRLCRFSGTSSSHQPRVQLGDLGPQRRQCSGVQLQQKRGFVGSTIDHASGESFWNFADIFYACHRPWYLSQDSGSIKFVVAG